MNKQISLAELVGEIRDGTRLALGGGGLQRKPMAAVRAIASSSARDLDLVAFLGGPDCDVLIGMGKVRRLTFAYLGFDAYGLAPCFRKARETGTLEAIEYSEASMLAGFDAAAKNLPFLPTRFGLGTDITRTPTSPFATIACPFTGETLLAVPALRSDVAILHAYEADRAGNAVLMGDAYADGMIARTAKRCFVTAERVVDRIARDHSRRSTLISRLWVSGVVEAPGGARFTAQFPDYPLDIEAMLAYQAKAIDAVWLERFVADGRTA
ncbi:MAG: CoA transferase subunit A [Alphaproteobacteria bacterium]|nr:CoA transferase subunit A [Alphaproteobacteria bacterium]